MTTTVTATATCTAHRGVVETTGRLLNAAALAERVGWMSAIVRDMTGADAGASIAIPPISRWSPPVSAVTVGRCRGGDGWRCAGSAGQAAPRTVWSSATGSGG